MFGQPSYGIVTIGHFNPYHSISLDFINPIINFTTFTPILRTLPTDHLIKSNTNSKFSIMSLSLEISRQGSMLSIHKFRNKRNRNKNLTGSSYKNK
jgi:hypothetical protein